MPMVISPESEAGKELAKWEAPKRQGGMRCDGYEAFPAMLYRAHLRNGKCRCLVNPMTYRTEAEQLDAAAFNTSCIRIVKDEAEYRLARGSGWWDSAQAAIEACEHEQLAIADLAAERAFHDQRLSQKAQAEVQAVERQTDEHVVDVVPAKPRRGRPRGRPFQKKAVPVTSSHPQGDHDDRG